VQLGEIDPPAQRDEISGGQTVLLEYLFNDLQVIAARQIHRPRVPVTEARLQPPKCLRPDCIRWLQQTMDFIALHIRSPKLQQAIAEDAPMPELDELLENRITFLSAARTNKKTRLRAVVREAQERDLLDLLIRDRDGEAVAEFAQGFEPHLLHHPDERKLFTSGDAGRRGGGNPARHVRAFIKKRPLVNIGMQCRTYFAISHGLTRSAVVFASRS
jgi:hypothetical protein